MAWSQESFRGLTTTPPLKQGKRYATLSDTQTFRGLTTTPPLKQDETALIPPVGSYLPWSNDHAPIEAMKVCLSCFCCGSLPWSNDHAPIEATCVAA